MIFDFSNNKLYNEIYLPLLHDASRFKILYGGRDSGKSDFIAQAAIISLLGPDFFRMILLRRYYASIKQSQYQTIIDYIRKWNLSEYFHITINPLTITCKKTGNQILARGLDQPDNTKSIKDPTQIWYEEVDQITEAAFVEASLSLRSSRTDKLTEWLSFNPRNESSWINRVFFPVKNSYETNDGAFHRVESVRPNTTILHTTYRDNAFCSAERARRLESLREHDENWYNVNTLGLWGGALKGLIYPNWKSAKFFPAGGDEVFGMDYGFNNNTALVHLSYQGDKQIFIKQLLYVRNHNHQDVVNSIVRNFKDVIGQKPIYIDSAEKPLVSALANAGFNAIASIKGPRSVYDGIMLCQQFEFQIVENESPDIVNEIRQYVWKRDRADNAVDEPVKIDDHAMDAIRYPIQSYGKYRWASHSLGNGGRKKRDRKNKKLIVGY